MNKQLENPFLKQLVSNIASNAKQGRITNLTWGTLNEARKKKNVREGNMAPKKAKPDNTEERPADEIPSDDVGPAGTEAPKGNPNVAPGGEEGGDAAGGLPPLGGGGGGGGGGGDLGGDLGGGEPDGPPTSDTGAETPPEEENPEDAQADATAAKAELEKAKAEKDQAEKEIKKQSYVNLVSGPGVHFLLGKLVDHAFKTNTIDSLASEMTGKLKIQTSDDFSNFVEEMSPFKGIPGVAELLAAMKGMATKQPDTGEEVA